MPDWVKDEDTWDRAKKEVERKPDMSDDEYWGTVTKVYKDMGGKVGSLLQGLNQIAHEVQELGLNKHAYQIADLSNKIAEWTEEQERRFQEWKKLYEPKFSPEKIDEVRALWEEKGYGRTENLPPDEYPEDQELDELEHEEIAPPPPSSPYQEKRERERTEERSEAYVGWDWQRMTPEEQEQWLRDHPGMSPQYSEPRFRVVEERVKPKDETDKKSDLDPQGQDTDVPEFLQEYDTYNGSDPMSKPGISVKTEGDQVQIYVIEDPEEEVYGELYLQESDEGWSIEKVFEQIEDEDREIIPEGWSTGTTLTEDDLKEWLDAESLRF